METQGASQKQPLVSIVRPAHNEGEWIATCLESVLRTDDYPNKEVIVVDDASSDGTGDMLKHFSVKVIRTEKPDLEGRSEGDILRSMVNAEMK